MKEVFEIENIPAGDLDLLSKFFGDCRSQAKCQQVQQAEVNLAKFSCLAM